MSYWDNPREWPYVPSGYVFVPDAFEAIGRKIWPDEWVPGEPFSTDEKIRRKQVAVMDVLQRLLESGRVRSCVASTIGEMIPVNRAVWNCPPAMAAEWLKSCAINVGGAMAVRAGLPEAMALYAHHSPAKGLIFLERSSLHVQIDGIVFETVEGEPTRSEVVVADLLRPLTERTIAPADEQPTPAPPSASNEKKPADLISKEVLADWFKNERVPSLKKGERIPDWKSCLAAARAKFPDKRIMVKVLRSARNDACPPVWSKRGGNRRAE